MKKKSWKMIWIAAVFVLSTLSATAQNSIQDNPNYGPDSTARMNCAANLSTMSEFVKIKVYDYAYNSWRYCFNNCPASSKNIYIMGESILENKIDKTVDENLKEKYVDTLMMLYDQRMEYFQQEGLVLGKKGVELLRYRKSAIQQAYGYLGKSIDLRKTLSDEAVLVTYMQTSNVLFHNKLIDAAAVISDYIKVTNIIDEKPVTSRTQLASESVEKIFSSSGAADCESLVNIYTPKFEADSTNIDLLKNVTGMLLKSSCDNSSLFARAAENLYKLEPSANAAYNLAKLFLTKNEYQKSINYYKEAIDQESDPNSKADYYYQVGLIELARLNNNQEAKNYALEALKLNPKLGNAYILIGNAYATNTADCGSTNFEKAAIYLAAVDKYIKAKEVDPSVTEEANNLINRYSQYFPNNEDAFFNGYTDGKTYKIGCWINETTTVRTVKNK